jgi:hypothetical protein
MPRDAQPAAKERAFEDHDLHQAQPAPLPQPKPRLKPGDRSSKFFIELHENKPAPAVQSQVKGEPLARAEKKEPAQIEKKAPARAESSAARPVKKAADKFNWKMRRNIFIGLLIFTLLGAMVSVYNFFRNRNEPIGFGPATEIELLADGLYVRAEPSTRGKVLGSVIKGSKHHVITMQPDKNWVQIQVGAWADRFDANADTGWIYGDLNGNPPRVRVVSRKFWR